jgi:hypothetical protein
VRKLFEWGGYIAGAVLIVFGIVAIVISVMAFNDVRSNLKQENIVGSPDMTPTAIQAAGKEAGLTNVTYPTCSVAGQQVTTGAEARCFAEYMRIHALEASGGKTYSEMPRYATADGKGTNDPAQAQKDANGQPVSNAARDLWVTETALTTALNMAYMGEQLSYFGIVVGIALILSGIGFIVLTLRAALRSVVQPAPAAPAAEPAPA